MSEPGDLGNTLRSATSAKHRSDVERLLQLDRKLANDPGQYGITALHIASKQDDPDLLRLLIDSGAAVNQQDDFGRSALHYAAAYGLVRSVDILLRTEADVNMRTAILWTPLHFASQYNRLPVIEQLLKAKAKVSLTDNLGWSPLHIASREGHEQAVLMLLKAGALVQHTDNRGWTALHVAVQSNHATVSLLLVHSGAEVNLQEETGRTPLHLASQSGSDRIVKQLLSAGASVDLQTKSGQSALFCAVQTARIRVVVLLLEAGADATLRSKSGISPLTLAFCLGYRDIALQLIRHLLRKSGVDEFIAALPASCASVFTAGQLSQVRERPSNDDGTSTTCDRPDRLHTAMLMAGFSAQRSATLASAADVLQEIIRKLIIGSELAYVVGSFGDGWGNSLSSLDGHIDSDSDIDVTTFSSGTYHLKGNRCQCKQVDPELIVEYENGHIKKEGFPACPSRVFNGSNLKPAMDSVTASPLCCYPYVDLLENPERLKSTHLTHSIVQSLLQELRTPSCHVVAAAPPGKEGRYLRVSSTLFERILMRSLTDVQGQLFIILKYLVKTVLSRKVIGLKTYYAKTLLFILLDKTPADLWKPEDILPLAQRALELLLGSLHSTGPGECMRHFFMSDAVLYLKKEHSSKEEIIAAIRETITQFEPEISVFLHQLRPPQDLSRLYFQPYLMIPNTMLQLIASQSGEPLYHEIFAVIKDALNCLSDADCCMQSLSSAIDRIPDYALAARESLRMLAWLKSNGSSAAPESVPVVSKFAEMQKPVDVPILSGGTDAIWQHLRGGHSTWKFCFHFHPVPTLAFLPEHLREAFPCETQNYNDFRYVNFDALHTCLCLELKIIQEEQAASWFEEVVNNRHADIQELFVALHYCCNLDLLVRLMHAHGRIMSDHPLTSQKLDNLIESKPKLLEYGCLRTLQQIEMPLQ